MSEALRDLVPQADPGAWFRQHRAATLDALARVVDSGWYVLGRAVADFEAAFAAECGVRHGVGVANGTDALVLALRALGIGPGDRVITVSHTAVATVAAIRLAGATPVLVDISPRSYTMEPLAVADALAVTPGVKAIVAVHLYGQMVDMPGLLAVAARHGLQVVEDCAQAHGAAWQGQPAGSFGAAAAFSFYPTKNLGALGDAGIVVTDDAAVAERLQALRQYGWRQRYVSDIEGLNSRLDELQAAVLSARLPHLAAGNERRRAIAAAYDAALAGTSLGLPCQHRKATHVFHQYVVRHPQRDALQARLRERGVATNVHYPVPVHLQPGYAPVCEIAPGGLAFTEAAAREVLSLPMYPELDDAAVARVVETILTSL